MNYNNLFKLSAAIVTVIALLLTISLSARFSEKNNLPEDNFVKVVAIYYIDNSTLCEEGIIEDSGNFCQKGKIEISRSSASGVAFKKTKDSTFILTADHFCSPDLGISRIMQDSLDVISEITAYDSMGRSWKTEKVYVSEADDLCLLSSDIEIDSEIKISKIFPVPGDKVTAISAPHGIHDRNVSLHFSGIFSGCDYNDICFYTIPAAPGSSGSLILNTEGKIVGMIQMTSSGFGSLSIGVGLTSIRKFLLSAENHLSVELM